MVGARVQRRGPGKSPSVAEVSWSFNGFHGLNQPKTWDLMGLLYTLTVFGRQNHSFLKTLPPNHCSLPDCSPFLRWCRHTDFSSFFTMFDGQHPNAAPYSSDRIA